MPPPDPMLRIAWPTNDRIFHGQRIVLSGRAVIRQIGAGKNVRRWTPVPRIGENLSRWSDAAGRKRARGHGLASGPARVQKERHSWRPPHEERQPAAIPSAIFMSREPGRQHRANGRMDQRDALDTLNLIAETAGQYADVVPATCQGVYALGDVNDNNSRAHANNRCWNWTAADSGFHSSPA